MVKTMESYAQAYELVKKARTNNTLATVLGGAGGAFVGFPLGQAMGGGDANWTLAGIGLGLVAVSIPLSSGTNKNLQQAVELYNASLSAPSSYHFNPKFELTAVENIIGIVMIF